MTAAASGQRERVVQLMQTALPRVARDSPEASLTKFSTVPTTGPAEKEGFPRVPQLAVRKGPTKNFSNPKCLFPDRHEHCLVGSGENRTTGGTEHSQERTSQKALIVA